MFNCSAKNTTVSTNSFIFYIVHSFLLFMYAYEKNDRLVLFDFDIDNKT